MDTSPPAPPDDTDGTDVSGTSDARRWTMFAPLLVLFVVLAAWNLSITVRGNPRHSPEDLICQRVATTRHLVERGQVADAESFTGTIVELATESVPELVDQATELDAAVVARSAPDIESALGGLIDHCEIDER